MPLPFDQPKFARAEDANPPNLSDAAGGHFQKLWKLPKATTVRAFLVSFGPPKADVTKEAHHLCRKVGNTSNPRRKKL